MSDDLIIKTIFKAIDRITGPVRRMSRGVGKFGRSASRHIGSVQKITSKMGRAIQQGVVRAFKAAVVAAVALGVALKKVIEIGAGFEKTLVIAATKFPGEIRKGSAEYKVLEDAARKAGATTEFTARQSALALKELGAAGIETVEKAAAILPQVIDFATAAEIEVGAGAKMAMRVLGALDMKITPENLARSMDVMKNASDSAAQSMEDVYESMLDSAPTAKMFNQDIETLGASIIGMARSGIVAQKSGIAYRNMMLALAATTPAAKKALHKMHIELEDDAKNLRDPIAIVKDFSQALEGMGTREKARKLKDVFGKRPITAFNALLSRGSEQLKEFEEAGRKAAGSVSRSAEAIRDTTAGSIDTLKASIESVIISLFKLDDKGIKGVIDRMTEWVRANEKLIVQKVGGAIEWIADNWEKIVAILKQVGTTVGTMWALSKAVDAVAGALSFVKLIKAANPITLAIIAIMAAVALLAGVVVKNWEKITATWDRGVSAARKVGTSIINIFKAIGTFFQDLWAVYAGIFWAGVKAIAGPGTPLGYLVEVVLVLRAAWSSFAEFMGDLWQGIKEGIGPFISWIWDRIKDLVSAMGWLVGKIGSAISYVVGENVSSVHKLAEEARKQTEIDKEALGFGDKKVIRIMDRKISHAVDAVVRTQDRTSGEADVIDFYPNPHTTPAARAVSITERKETTTTKQGTLTIKDDTGRAEYEGDDPWELGMSFERTGSL